MFVVFWIVELGLWWVLFDLVVLGDLVVCCFGRVVFFGLL